MRIKSIAVFAAVLIGTAAFAQNAGNYKFYGFIRNYVFIDTHASNKVGAGDIFYYMPNDTDEKDVSTHFTAITSRLGVDISGYEFNGVNMGAKIETDFYNGLSGVTGAATLRLRQAYMTLGWTDKLGESNVLKIGQAWHPMAADMPDIFSLNTGAPFGAFSRTPLLQWDSPFADKWSMTYALAWQMQYTSCGPEGASANYMKYSGIPELYIGINYKTDNFTGRFGFDWSSIRPYSDSNLLEDFQVFAFAQYKKDLFSLKFKTSFGENGAHLNLVGGYGVSSYENIDDHSTFEFTSTLNSSSWLSLMYGKKVQGVFFAGFVKNFGTSESLARPDLFWFYKNGNSNVNSLYRITPQVVFNWGKLALAFEIEHTAAQYGNDLNLESGLFESGLHWVSNTRFQSTMKFTF